jgi:hypothetical protein
MTSHDFPCFLCGFEGPHRVVPAERLPHVTDAEWEQQIAPDPMLWMLVLCGACGEFIWEPDTGDGDVAPNLTRISPELRDLAHRTLDARNVTGFLILARREHLAQFVEDNRPILRRLGMWDDA